MYIELDIKCLKIEIPIYALFVIFLGKKKRIKKRRSSESEAGEESDDGDEEGREMDYISDSSASDSDKELKGVAEEDALRKLLSSGEEDEDEEKQDEKNKVK